MVSHKIKPEAALNLIACHLCKAMYVQNKRMKVNLSAGMNEFVWQKSGQKLQRMGSLQLLGTEK